MSDYNAEFTSTIKTISDSITVQFFSLFYHFFLTANNNYINKYHAMMNVMRQNGDLVDENSLRAAAEAADTVALNEIKAYLNHAFIRVPEVMMQEDELLPAEKEFFYTTDPQLERIFLEQNFSKQDVTCFQADLMSFLRLLHPYLAEMEHAYAELQTAFRQKSKAVPVDAVPAVAESGARLPVFGSVGKAFRIAARTAASRREDYDGRVFDTLFKYCISWQNFIETLRNHAKDLYQIYQNFFNRGLMNKYERFYNEVKDIKQESACSFFREFLHVEIAAYDNELNEPANPGNPEDRQTIREVVCRVEKYFSEEDIAYY